MLVGRVPVLYLNSSSFFLLLTFFGTTEAYHFLFASAASFSKLGLTSNQRHCLRPFLSSLHQFFPGRRAFDPSRTRSFPRLDRSASSALRIPISVVLPITNLSLPSPLTKTHRQTSLALRRCSPRVHSGILAYAHFPFFPFFLCSRPN